MTDRTTIHRLQVATPLAQFIDQQVLPGTGVDPWEGVSRVNMTRQCLTRPAVAFGSRSGKQHPWSISTSTPMRAR